jgi:hypothetical protein
VHRTGEGVNSGGRSLPALLHNEQIKRNLPRRFRFGVREFRLENQHQQDFIGSEIPLLAVRASYSKFTDSAFLTPPTCCDCGKERAPSALRRQISHFWRLACCSDNIAIKKPRISKNAGPSLAKVAFLISELQEIKNLALFFKIVIGLVYRFFGRKNDALFAVVRRNDYVDKLFLLHKTQQKFALKRAHSFRIGVIRRIKKGFLNFGCIAEFNFPQNFIIRVIKFARYLLVRQNGRLGYLKTLDQIGSGNDVGIFAEYRVFARRKVKAD